MTSTTEHRNRIGPRSSCRYAKLIVNLEPTPENLACQIQKKDPKQQQTGEDGPKPSADQTHGRKDQAMSDRQDDWRKKIAEKLSHPKQ